MRTAFGLAQALMIILVISGIVTVTMKYASINAQHYADSYTREQAELFMQSATEAALLQISGHNRTTQGCLRDLNITSSDSRFIAQVTVEKYYLADGTICTGGLSVPIQSEESHGIIIMNIIVETNASNSKVLHPVRLERRSLQRP